MRRGDDMENLTVEMVNGILIFIILSLQLIGVALSVAVDSNLDKKRRLIMMALILSSFLLVLQNYAENILIEYVFAPRWRTFVAAFGYSLRPLIIVLFVYMIAPERKHWWTWILVGINGILYNTAYFSDVVFTISRDTNAWLGGPLSNLCMIVSAILLAYHVLICILEFHFKDKNKNDYKKYRILTPMFFTLLVVIGIILDIYKKFWLQHWVDYVTIAVVSCCVFFYLWLHFIFVRRYQSALLAEQRYNSMISQMQPHFIYNSLSAIAEIEGVPEKAQDAIANFSMYLRENLDAMTSSELISFDKELEHIKKYIELEKLRFGEKVNVVFDIKCSDFLLPALTVQILVENAIKHGITKKYAGGTVTVSTEKKDKKFVITVCDDGIGFDAKSDISGSHFGIHNIRKRLEYAVNGTLQIESVIGKGTTATIAIPIGDREKKHDDHRS